MEGLVYRYTYKWTSHFTIYIIIQVSRLYEFCEGEGEGEGEGSSVQCYSAIIECSGTEWSGKV